MTETFPKDMSTPLPGLRDVIVTNIDIRVVTLGCLSVSKTEVQKFVNYVCSLTSDSIQSSKQVN